MFVKASHKYQSKFGFVRKTNAYLNNEQQDQFRRAIQVENRLYNFALRYLYATYGKTHLDRYYPIKVGRRVLATKIKLLFMQKYFNRSRWNVNEMYLSSHNAQLFLVQLLTNFGEYRKELRKNAKNMDKKARYNFKQNITKDKRGRHKNSQHKSWYRIGGLGFNADNRTILIDLQPNAGLTVLSMHKIKIPDYGVFYIQGNAYDLCQDKDICQVKLKWQHDQTFQLQLVHAAKKPKPRVTEQTKALGLDWNMTDNFFIVVLMERVFNYHNG